jgi:hypothetical protein
MIGCRSFDNRSVLDSVAAYCEFLFSNPRYVSRTVSGCLMSLRKLNDRKTITDKTEADTMASKSPNCCFGSECMSSSWFGALSWPGNHHLIRMVRRAEVNAAAVAPAPVCPDGSQPRSPAAAKPSASWRSEAGCPE